MLALIGSGGLGQIDHMHLDKNPPEIGMLIVKIGGPAYRIGMGGGAASSVASGSNKADLDFNAVQVTILAQCCAEDNPSRDVAYRKHHSARSIQSEKNFDQETTHLARLVPVSRSYHCRSMLSRLYK